MVHEHDLILFRLRAFLVGTLIVAILVLLWVLVSTTHTDALPVTDGGFSDDSLGSDMSDSPNIIARDMFSLTTAIDRSLSSVRDGLGGMLQPVTLPRLPKFQISTLAAGIGNGALRAAGNGLGSVVQAEVQSAIFVLRIPGNTMGFISDTAVSAVVKPAEHDPVPIIDPHSPELAAAQAALPATVPATRTSQAPAVIPQWPLHGIITTEFGVPEPPYQPIHTGLDISDGHRPGVTPIRPFRPGRVIEAIHSRIRLGNEVVVDHGSGVTSVYGHLNSISVQEGQTVDENTVLGYEGTTGVSTGPHLHFEIRINGRAVDPHKFISGQP